MTKRFLILGMQRTGTTFVSACAHGHPQTTMLAPELRQNFFGVGLQDFVAGQGSFEHVRDTFPRLFDAMTIPADVDAPRANGAKTAIVTHEEAVAICDCLDQFFPDMAIVLVTRADLVASCGSQLRARKSGVWHSWAGSSPAGTIRIPPRTFRRYVRTARLIEQRFRRLADTHELLELRYEEDVCGGAAHEKLFAFLGLEPTDPTWVKTQKLNPDAQRYIRNYDHLQRMLAASANVPVAEEEAEAARVRERLAGEQTSAYLLGRAADHAHGGRWARGVEDLRHALTHGDAVQRTFLIAKTYAAFEAGDGQRHPQIPQMLARIDAACGDNPTFRQLRAAERERNRRWAEARIDLTAALLSDLEALGAHGVRNCLCALARVLRELADPALDEESRRQLAVRHGDHADFARLPDAARG